MLVLGRRAGEEIKIGDDITVTVVDLRPGNARIGIAAPIEVPITRPDSRTQQSDKRTTLLSYIADTRRQLVTVGACIDAFDSGTPADECIEAIRRIINAPID